jgi:hypothetical protein
MSACAGGGRAPDGLYAISVVPSLSTSCEPWVRFPYRFVVMLCSKYYNLLGFCRWQYVDKFRKRLKKGHEIHMSGLMDGSNMMALCRGIRHPVSSPAAGTQVYMNKCNELGVVPNSRVMEMMDMVCFCCDCRVQEQSVVTSELLGWTIIWMFYVLVVICAEPDPSNSMHRHKLGGQCRKLPIWCMLVWATEVPTPSCTVWLATRLSRRSL